MDCQALFELQNWSHTKGHKEGQTGREGAVIMPQHTLFERSGLTIVVQGELTREEIEILEHEVKTTILDILKFRKFGGGTEL